MIKPPMPESEQARTIADSIVFKNCLETTLQRIYSEGELVQYSIGHALSTGAIIPNRVLVILKGKVRLIGKHKGQMNSLAQLGVGSVVGLASLLRAEPCEEIGAATKVEAWSIPDTLISDRGI